MRQLVIIWCILLCTTHVFSQEQTKVISGSITDIIAVALIGANVQSFPSLKGTSTDLDGNFQFNIPSSDTHLLISYTGYIDEKILLKDITTSDALDITLSEGITLNEVVVKEYSRAKRGFCGICICQVRGINKKKHVFSAPKHLVFESNVDFKMFPNPASHFITIENITEFDQIQIHSTDGKRVLFKELGPYEKHQLDISALANGSYIVQIISKGKIKTEKLEVMKVC